MKHTFLSILFRKSGIIYKGFFHQVKIFQENMFHKINNGLYIYFIKKIELVQNIQIFSSIILMSVIDSLE